METNKPYDLLRGRAALLACACLLNPVQAGEPTGASGMAQNELSSRSVALQEAQELLTKGDEAYLAGRYGDAVEAYAGAKELIPNAPVSAALRSAATDRYAQASVEYARVLVRGGDLAGAKAAVDKVLAGSVAPNNPGALAYRDQLDDSIRTNPALTKEFARNVDKVRRHLYTADGAYELGDFNQAKREYESVLRIDPTNTAARRGLEKLAAARSDYSKAAYDHARAEMLAEVDAGWETKVPAFDVEPILNDDRAGFDNGQIISVRNKLDRIIIPKVSLDQASLEEALDFLRIRSAENDTTELDPDRKGVNFRVNLGAADSPTVSRVNKLRFDLQLSQIPLSQVLKYITDITQTTYSTDEFSVVISPPGSASSELVTRSYRVPPDFISSISTGAGPAAPDDPFGGEPSGGGLLATRLGAQEALVQQGVAFPQGASASYTPASNTLRVVNTSQNQDFISQIIETIAKTETVMVSVHVTMIKVQQTRLEELGFEWLLDNFGFGGDAWVPGQSRLNLGGGTVGNGSLPDDFRVTPGRTNLNPITSGNRSGDYAITGNTINKLIASQGDRQASNPAPGVIAVRGEISNATVQTLMRGLDQKKGVDLMARPSTITRSGQSTSVTMIREFIYPSEYEPPELPNSVGSLNQGQSTPVTPAHPTEFKKRDVGISMDVLPVVDDNKQIVNVTINPVFTEFDGFVNYGSPINSTTQGLFTQEVVNVTRNEILQPVFSVNRLSTNVDVLDGATLVIGGLMQDQMENVADHTPILGSIPIIGRLFESKAVQPTTTAIIFLVGVEIMDPTGRRYRDR
jgi:general secretion pathway protein D